MFDVGFYQDLAGSRLHKRPKKIYKIILIKLNLCRCPYDQPNQFNREYARMFGMPPIRDMKRLRGALMDSEKW